MDLGNHGGGVRCNSVLKAPMTDSTMGWSLWASQAGSNPIRSCLPRRGFAQYKSQRLDSSGCAKTVLNIAP